eukprot:s745_g5.t10
MRRSCLHKRPLAQCELGSCMGPCAVCCCRVSSQPAGSVFTAGLAESAVADDSERIVEIFTAFHGPRPSERWGEMFTRRCKDVTLAAGLEDCTRHDMGTSLHGLSTSRGPLIARVRTLLLRPRVFEKGSVAFREDRWKSAQPQAQGTDQVRATRVTHTWQTTESFLSEVRMRGSSGVQHGTVPDSISDDGLVRDAGEGCWQGEVVGRPAVPEGELCGNGEAVRGDPGALAWEALLSWVFQRMLQVRSQLVLPSGRPPMTLLRGRSCNAMSGDRRRVRSLGVAEGHRFLC